MPVTQKVFLPVKNQVLVQLLALMQKNTEGGSDDFFEEEMTILEAIIIVVLFLTCAHLLARLCHRRSDSEPNYYAKTERQLKLLSERERRNGSSKSVGKGTGPDYIQF